MVKTEKIVVLNVDDYEAGRYATSRVLRQSGYEVVEAASGQEALRLAADRPDLVVLDVNLPDLSGFEVCRRIKNDPQTASIPVLYLSAAYRGPEHRAQGLELGADGYLTQPVDGRELVATVNALLRTRHVREAVEHSEQRFRSLMTATSDIIWTTDARGRFDGEQQDWSDFTGQSLEEYRGEGWLAAVHPDDREQTQRLWSRALEERTLYEQEIRLRHRSGEYRYMVVRAVPVLEADGTLREWVGAHSDVTARRRAEQALRERHDRLQLLSDAANRLLMTQDPREYVDRLLRQLSSYLDLEVYFNYLLDDGRSTLLLATWQGIAPEVEESMRQVPVGESVCGLVAVSRREFVGEEVSRSDDPILEVPRRLEVRAYACFPVAAGTHLIGTVSFGSRSRPRFTEDELALMRTVCNQISVALERARLVDELQARNTALEEANRAKADFLATMSHELRTPLNAMIGYTDLLLLGVPRSIPEPSRVHVERIRNAAVHLTQLIEEVLTHARIEAGREELHLETLDPREVAEEVSALVEPLARQKGLAFRLDHRGSPERMETDPRKLRQILLNLLGNAVKFTDQGEISLEMRTEGRWLVARVADTGIGIDAEHLEKIFEPFWQVDGSKTRIAGGTGLGLNVVRQLAERLGGRVGVESTPGRGSRFTVHLPIR